MIDPATQALLRPFLLSGERLLWTGRPARGIALRMADLYLIPFSLVWGAIIVAQTAGDWSGALPLIFFLWTTPLVAFVLYITFGRFAHEAWIRSHLFYAITDQRVLVLRIGPRQRLRSSDIGYLPMLDLEEDSSGRGTIRFDFDDDPSPPHGNLAPMWRPAVSTIMAFDRIEQPRVAYDLIRREAERRRAERIAALPPGREFIG